MSKIITMLASLALASLVAYAALANTGKLKVVTTCYGDFYTVNYMLGDTVVYHTYENHK